MILIQLSDIWYGTVFIVIVTVKNAFLWGCSFLRWEEEWRQTCHSAWHHLMGVVPKQGHLDNSGILMGVFSLHIQKWWLTESAFDFRLGFGLHPSIIPIHTDAPLTPAHVCSPALKPQCLPEWRTGALWHFGLRPLENQQNLFKLLNSVDSNLFCLCWKYSWASAALPILANGWRFWQNAVWPYSPHKFSEVLTHRSFSAVPGLGVPCTTADCFH